MPISHGMAFSLKYSHRKDVRQPFGRPGFASGRIDRPCMVLKSAALPPARSTTVGAMSSASTSSSFTVPGLNQEG